MIALLLQQGLSRRFRGFAFSLSLLLVGSSGCTVDLAKDEGAPVSENQCNSNSECGSGECFSGACVAHEGKLSSVLLEILPPKNAVGVGGVRYLQTLGDLAHSNASRSIDLQAATQVQGYVLASAEKQCADGARTFAVDVTFTPREDAYGLGSITYVAHTERVTIPDGHPCKARLGALTAVDQFTVLIPNGAYDVYVKPQGTSTAAGDGSSCNIVPQLFRKISLADAQCLVLPWTAPQKLDVVIPWDEIYTGSAALDGWSLEVVHPISGQLLSGTETLAESDRKQTSAGYGYAHAVSFTPVAGDEPGKEIVRLSPPKDVVAPVVQADRSGLQVASADAVFPTFAPLPTPVSVDWWLYKRTSLGDAGPPEPVAGNVSFVATALTGVKKGIFASYATSVTVQKGGALVAKLLPGTYRTRVVPDADQDVGATESTADVRCAANDASGICSVQHGRVVSVSPAATVSGTILDAITRRRVDGASVDAVPASSGERNCSDASEPACAVPLGVLDVGQDAFVPRFASTVAQSGRFVFAGLDCGECTNGSGALFDFVARPPIGKQLPWAIRSGLVVSSDLELDPINVPLPIVQSGKVQIPQATQAAQAVSSAVIKAYVLRDERGNIVTEPGTLPTCASVASTTGSVESSHCVRSSLQVAETTTSSDGSFQLVLPSELQ